jgi:3-isopropylmalate/(R)-2-methylmalate dehydratase large subunit
MQVAGAQYKAIEFTGSTLKNMSMEERMTLCNMAIEAGGKNGIIAPDETTFAYIKERRPDYEYEPVYSSPDAKYEAEYTVDVANLIPLVAAPHSPDNRKTAQECKDVPIDRSYIGSCTGVLSALFMSCFPFIFIFLTCREHDYSSCQKITIDC